MPKKRLRVVAGTETGKTEDGKQAASPGKPSTKIPDGKPELPEDWSKIKAGSLVLAREAVDEGWFESIVTDVGSDGAFWLRWRDWPDLDAFVRYRSQLALLYPAATAVASN